MRKKETVRERIEKEREREEAKGDKCREKRATSDNKLPEPTVGLDP